MTEKILVVDSLNHPLSETLRQARQASIITALAHLYMPPLHMLDRRYIKGKKPREMRKCRLPQCEVMHSHNGGYCCAEHFKQHNGK